MVNLQKQDNGLVVVGIDFGGTFVMVGSLLELALGITGARIKIVRFEQIWIACDSLFEFPFGLLISLACGESATSAISYED